MLEFPQTTEFGKKTPKQKFYDKADIPASVRSRFAAEIENIVWRNKFSADTLRVEQGEQVTEIELLYISLRQKFVSKAVLETMVAAIPYHLIFLLEFANEFQLRAAYSLPRDKLFWYASPWLPYNALSLRVLGLNLDTIYENFVRQIAEEKLRGNESPQIAAERELARLALQKRIASLSKKLRTERQFKRQAEINRELRDVKRELAALDY